MDSCRNTHAEQAQRGAQLKPLAREPSTTEPSTPKQDSPVTAQCHSSFWPQPDRTSSQSHSFFQSYGTVLPTSLTYIVLVTRGCSPWRPAADMGTVCHQDYTPELGFSRVEGSAPDRARTARLYVAIVHISGRTYSMDSNDLKRKDNSPQGYLRRLRAGLRYRTGSRRSNPGVQAREY
jgi:hypothetical protein